MGNNSCVGDGTTPNSMGYILINNSSKSLFLSDFKCICERHRGFSALHGKFKEGYEPENFIKPGGNSRCWMYSGEGSAVHPVGWVNYSIEDGGSMEIEYESDKWRHDRYGALIQVSISDCPSLTVSVEIKNIESKMGPDFEGTSEDQQFEIVVSDDTKGDGNREVSVGLAIID